MNEEKSKRKKKKNLEEFFNKNRIANFFKASKRPYNKGNIYCKWKSKR